MTGVGDARIVLPWFSIDLAKSVFKGPTLSRDAAVRSTLPVPKCSACQSVLKTRSWQPHSLPNKARQSDRAGRLMEQPALKSSKSLFPTLALHPSNRYILGETASVSSATVYTTGTVELEGRTPAPELVQVCGVEHSAVADSAGLLVTSSLKRAHQHHT